MKLQGARIEGFVTRPDPACRAVLLFGPDHGLVRDRAERIGRTVVPDLTDPFRVADLTGAMVAEDPARLVDEMASLSLMGGRRLVRVREAGDSITDAVAATLAAGENGDSLLLMEGGELETRSRLRKLVEAAPQAAAIACYVEESGDLARVISQILKEQHLTADRDALALLTENLVSDRMLVRGELEKLALYMGPGGGQVSLTEVRAVIGDSAVLDLDDAVWDAADGNHAALERSLGRLVAEGTAAVTLLRAAQRHFQRLHVAAAALATGSSVEAAVACVRPPVFFKQTNRFGAQLRRWPLPRLRRALDILTAAELSCKSSGAPDTLVCARAFHELTTLAAAARLRG